MTDTVIELRRFIGGDCDPANFPHREHVRVAFEMLRRHSFPETVLHFSQALRQMAARAARPEAYHETITIAFLSVIAERMGHIDAFDAFASANPDLLDKRALVWRRTTGLRLRAADLCPAATEGMRPRRRKHRQRPSSLPGAIGQGVRDFNFNLNRGQRSLPRWPTLPEKKARASRSPW